MATQTIERPVQRPSADPEALFPGPYLSVTEEGPTTTADLDRTQKVPTIRDTDRHDSDPLHPPIPIRQAPEPSLDDRSHTPPHGDALLTAR